VNLRISDFISRYTVHDVLLGISCYRKLNPSALEAEVGYFRSVSLKVTKVCFQFHCTGILLLNVIDAMFSLPSVILVSATDSFLKTE